MGIRERARKAGRVALANVRRVGKGIQRRREGRRLAGDSASVGVDQRLAAIAAQALKGEHVECAWKFFRLRHFPGWEHEDRRRNARRLVAAHWREGELRRPHRARPAGDLRLLPGSVVTDGGARTAKEKGDALEQAVREIESAILRSFPGYSESAFRIESKKILKVAGVRHEIDIYVTASLGPGYETVFIFECKNWEEKVGKNEIIVFAEKVQAANAQRGFFIAKSYTADALAQGRGNPRLELLLASEIDPAGIMVPFGFHLVHVEGIQIKPIFDAKKLPAEPAGTSPVELASAAFSVGGQAMNLKQYMEEWTSQAQIERLKQFNAADAEEGPHELEFLDERQFNDADAVLVEGRTLRRIEMRGILKVRVHKAVVLSVFEVATRGRCITVRIDSPDTEITANFVELRAQ
jgi:restriction endonuclease